MTRKEYLKIKDILDAWASEKAISIATDDKTDCIANEDGYAVTINPTEYNGNTDQFVIYDKYISFRLALMRGETVKTCGNTVGGWIDVLKSDQHKEIGFNGGVGLYMIEKPDTSWIEDGAFCRDKSNGKVHKIYIDEERSVGLVGCTAIDINAFVGIYEKWVPISREVCWFWDNWDDNEDSDENLPKLLEFHDEVLGKFRAKELAHTHYDHCAPYIEKKFWE